MSPFLVSEKTHSSRGRFRLARIMRYGFLGVSLVIMTGCATTPADRRESDIPWNQPQPWEGSPFIPGMDRY